MMLLGLGTPTLLAIACAVGLLVVVLLFLRLQKEAARLKSDVSRLQRMQKDSAADVRSRLDSNRSALSALEERVAPLGEVPLTGDQVAQMTATQVELSTRTAEFERRLAELEKRRDDSEAQVAGVKDEWTRLQSMVDRGERQLAAFEAGRESEKRRLEDLKESVTRLRSTLEQERAGYEARIEELAKRPRQVVAAPRASPSPAPSLRDVSTPSSPSSSSPSTSPPEDEPSPRRRASAAPSRVPPAPDAPRPFDLPEQGGDDVGARSIFLVLGLLLVMAVIAQLARG